jgi:5'-nucleotidase
MTYMLVTNDDGVNAPGILALTSAMQEFGDVRFAAPSNNQSASGHKKTLFADIPFKETTLSNGVAGLTITGSPADCIAVSALGGQQWPPRLVVSGINRGANMGQDVTYSGTVTAALESVIHGVPAIAFSLDNVLANSEAEYKNAIAVAKIVVKIALTKSLPPFTILNVNIPRGNGLKGIRITRQGVRIYNDELSLNGESYRIVGEPPTGEIDTEGTDLWAVHNGYASVTPIHLDLTAHHFMADLAAWDISL